MPQYQTCEEFSRAAEKLYLADPMKARVVLKYRHSDGSLYIKDPGTPGYSCCPQPARGLTSLGPEVLGMEVATGPSPAAVPRNQRDLPAPETQKAQPVVPVRKQKRRPGDGTTSPRRPCAGLRQIHKNRSRFGSTEPLATRSSRHRGIGVVEDDGTDSEI
ncbi:hypothetical protein E2I00_012080 [Balaenoptera physalus]|uniref:Signal recognition particle 9 kDa protein n=1 Tax=Balaenoptera physalus TaxID=9770 RepID=A0A643C890_BALPH|nr:hypothetical protein E2I00_012080 [Balaenoptera physalus]